MFVNQYFKLHKIYHKVLDVWYLLVVIKYYKNLKDYKNIKVDGLVINKQIYYLKLKIKI